MSEEKNVWERCLQLPLPTIEDARALVDRAMGMLDGKNQAYGPSWKLAGPVLPATLIFAKAARLFNLIGKLQFGEYEPHYESIRDTVDDLQNYLVFMDKMVGQLEAAHEVGEE